MAYVEAVCLSHKKGIVKKEQNNVVARENWGIEGDAHAGNWHRQISLLAGESIDSVKEILPTLKNGAFAENIITRGINLSSLRIGDRLQIGDEVILEITQIGKECHNSGCAIKKATGDCIMPREGLFAQVIKGGILAKEQQIRLMIES
jgi:MOSC domain-containing protein YiiM